ncbi:hypothetical protein NDU88_007238 [Pleurodeles waltl]|uniref:Uncharacterized protein n=1 Tax=Pleurodeles waltl TaxID=8319 RepID=A0AAV7QK43_PLEWA|nr:hypothetical protein NDU88_007238 [Pleurodeles waltl]
MGAPVPPSALVLSPGAPRAGYHTAVAPRAASRRLLFVFGGGFQALLARALPHSLILPGHIGGSVLVRWTPRAAGVGLSPLREFQLPVSSLFPSRRDGRTRPPFCFSAAAGEACSFLPLLQAGFHRKRLLHMLAAFRCQF